MGENNDHQISITYRWKRFSVNYNKTVISWTASVSWKSTWKRRSLQPWKRFQWSSHCLPNPQFSPELALGTGSSGSCNSWRSPWPLRKWCMRLRSRLTIPWQPELWERDNTLLIFIPFLFRYKNFLILLIEYLLLNKRKNELNFVWFLVLHLIFIKCIPQLHS